MSDIDFANFLGETSDSKAADSTEKPATEKPSEKVDEKADELKLDDESDDDEEDVEDDEEVEESDADDEGEEKKPELRLDDDEDIGLNIPNRAKIIKEFPELFKKYPSIEKAIYREQQYAEIFTHPKDAEQAKESLKTLGTIEAELGDGNIENLLNSVKKFDEKAFSKITGNFLGTLQKLDQPAYFKTVNYVLKSAIQQAHEYGKGADKESDSYQVALAARILNKWIYQTDKVDAPEPLVVAKTEVDPKAKELEDRENNYHKERLNGAVQEVDDRVLGTLTKSIEGVIDPKSLMTPYVKSNAIKDVLNQFKDDLRKDKRFTTNLDRLWRACRDDNYSDKSKGKIREAIKNQAKQVLPDIIRRVKADALKDYKKVGKSERKEERPLDRRRPSAGNHSSPSKPNGKFKLPEGKTATEYLLED